MALSSGAAFSNSKDSSKKNEGANKQVKQERPDEAEIEALAAKMVEANKAKMAAAATARLQQHTIGGPAGALPGSIQNFLLRGTPAAAAAAAAVVSTATLSSEPPLPPEESNEKKAPDDASQRGRFGWHTISNVHIPYLLRDGTDKYCAVRVAESKILSKYLAYLKADVYTCTCIKSFYMTEAEAKLMNEINMKHCDGTYGAAPFTVQDLVVLLKDAEEFQAFLEVCISKLVYDVSGSKDRCGFIRINGESVVPFTLAGDKKFVPLFYFEGETDSLKLKAEKLEGWNLSYLKFCCKVQGIRSELFSSDTCSVISLSDIRSYFPPGTTFEDYWPSKGVEKSLLLDPTRGQLGAPGGAWTVQPPKPPPPLPKPVAPKMPILANQTQVPTTLSVLNGWSGLVGGQAAYTNAGILQQAVHQQQQQQQQNYAAAAAAAAAARSVQPNLFRAGTTNMLYSGNSVLPIQNSASHQYYSQVSQGLSQQAHLLPGATPQPPPLIRVSSASTSNSRPTATYSSQPSRQQQQSVLASQQQQQQQVMNASQMLLNLGTPTATAAHQLLLQQQQQQQRNQLQQQQQQHRLQQLQMLQQQQRVQQHRNALVQQQQQQRTLAQQQASRQASANKYPPPLVSSNGTSQNSRSPQQQQQLRTSSRNAQPPSQQNSDSLGGRKLLSIAEVSAVSGHTMPFKMQKALIEGRMVPCINSKPYHSSELLMTMADLVEQFFPSVQLHTCRKVLQDVLGLDLYRGNRLQMQTLLEAGKCVTVNDVVPLVQVRDIMQFMPQMSYMFNRMGSNNADPSNKRQRTS